MLMFLAQRGMVESVKAILHFKVDLFKRNYDGLTVLDFTQRSLLKCVQDGRRDKKENLKQILLLLKAAGLKDSIKGIRNSLQKKSRPLQELCRSVIRDCLLEMNPECHLFLTIPKIPLPSGGLGNYYKSYLLYHQCLDTK